MFWFNCRGEMTMTGISKYTSDSAGKFICRYWYAYKPSKVNTFKPETSNRAFENRKCEHCQAAKRTRIMKTHNSENCKPVRIGTKGI
jgi:hypothetical protein